MRFAAPMRSNTSCVHVNAPCPAPSCSQLSLCVLPSTTADISASAAADGIAEMRSMVLVLDDKG